MQVAMMADVATVKNSASEADEETLLDVQEVEQQILLGALPFAFAKSHQVLIEREAGTVAVLSAGQPSVDTLLELQRHLGGPFSLHVLDSASFQSRLTAAYQRSNSEAAQMAEESTKELQPYQRTRQGDFYVSSFNDPRLCDRERTLDMTAKEYGNLIKDIDFEELYFDTVNRDYFDKLFKKLKGLN